MGDATKHDDAMQSLHELNKDSEYYPTRAVVPVSAQDIDAAFARIVAEREAAQQSGT